MSKQSSPSATKVNGVQLNPDVSSVRLERFLHDSPTTSEILMHTSTASPASSTLRRTENMKGFLRSWEESWYKTKSS
ncbi:hypothetical protein CSUB01_09782 [Colletotrichum sublineola]|uniref:Uncharacterized protein n=1 Tax=Colletotrichum sublineola TaxID=1173701 RepID=A0A066X6I1_COLSU|nr:hypothetical protein CSUB01_09782 [Colletotrichum sublineola]